MIRFDREIHGVAVGNGRFDIEITNHWSINGIPHGGYLMAALADTMLSQREATYTPIITANFISRCTPGKAFIQVEKIAASRQFDRYQASLFQEGEERVRALGTMANQAGDATLIRYESPPPEMAPLEDCLPTPEMPGYNLYDQVDLRMDPASVGWRQGCLVDKSEHRGWIRFKDHPDYTLPKILFVADAFPPPIFASQGMVAWVPTLELSVNIRKIPHTEWLRCVFRTRFITAGLLEEDGQVWDANGDLVAISRQIAQYRKNS